MSKIYKVVGYNLLLKLDPKEENVTNESGIIIAGNKSQHMLMSGIILEKGSMVDRDDPEIDIGDRVYFYDMDLKRIRVDSTEFGIISTNHIKVVEKEK